MAGWRDRAIPVESGSDWRSRATPVSQVPDDANDVPEDSLEGHLHAASKGESMREGPAAAAILGGAQGASLGWQDELAGAVDALQGKAKNTLQHFGLMKPDVDPNTRETIQPEDKSFTDLYRPARDQARALNQRAQTQNPTVFNTSKLAGDALAQTGANIATGGAMLTPGGQALMGGVSSLGNSEADLTQPTLKNVGQAALETGAGAAAGYLTGKATNGAANWLKNSRLANFLSDKVRGATADAAQLQSKKAAQALREGVASLGGATSSGNRTLTVLEDVLTNPAATMEQKAAAKQFLESEAGQQLKRGVYQGTLDRAGGELGRINQARSALTPLQQAATPEAIDAATDEYLKRGMVGEAAPRFKHYIQRALPPVVGSAVGGLAGNYLGGEHDKVGTTVGSLVGAGTGAALAGALGHPGTAFSNMMKSPAFRASAWNAVKNVMINAPQKLGQFVGPLVRSATPELVHSVLLNNDPNYVAKVNDLLGAQP